MSELHGELSPDKSQFNSATDPAYLENYLSFLQMTEADSERLRTFVPLFRLTSKSFVDTFYDHLLSFDETARFLNDPEVVTRLKELQKIHWESVLESQWDEGFVEQRQKVGGAHAERGVEPLFFLGANYQFIEHLIRAIEKSDNTAESESEHFEQFLSIVKAVFLDIGLTLESYFSQLSDDLRRALTMAWKANEELKQFARLTSHDMKTPLGTVANLCEEALDEFRDDMPAEAVNLIEKARKTVFRTSEMIDELLSVSITTEDEDKKSEVSCEDIINDVLERLSSELGEKDIEVTISSKLPFVVGNKVHLREAFYNLISNAEKYMNKSPGRIEISAKDGKEECVICVADNGPGIPPDKLDQIFSAFQRLPVHKNLEGSGLGLYFARSLIEHQDGHIWVESELGQGSQFYVQLNRSSPG